MNTVLKQYERKGSLLLFLGAIFSALVAIFLPQVALAAESVTEMPAQVVSLPWFTSREWIWIIAQLHINFAAFILGAPIFIVLCEFIGVRSKDIRYERLAHELTKVTAVCYSLTALTGGFFIVALVGLYPDFTGYLVTKFFWIIILLYPALFILETIILYVYIYSWEPLENRKGLHISIGVVLNLVGIATLMVMDIPASYMLSPDLESDKLWDMVNNYTWMPMNYHRLVGNVVFGGFVAGFVGAFMYIMSDKEKDRAYYDWQGFIGNSIGTFAVLFLPFMGYIYAKEVYAYDASLGMYMMSDRLSMFFVMQGLMVGTIFLASNYYIWLSTKRIEGAEKVSFFGVFEISRFLWMKFNFVILFFCSAVWLTPRHFMATMIQEANTGWYPDIGELPSHLGFMALMPAKNTAAFTIIVVTLINFLLYRAAIKKGKIIWGKIDSAAQYTLIFLAFSAIWLMALMGSIRELVRKNWHVYKQVIDTTPDSYTPTLAHSTTLVSGVSIVWILLVTFIVWVALIMGKKQEEDYVESEHIQADGTKEEGTA